MDSIHWNLFWSLCNSNFWAQNLIIRYVTGTALLLWRNKQTCSPTWACVHVHVLVHTVRVYVHVHVHVHQYLVFNASASSALPVASTVNWPSLSGNGTFCRKAGTAMGVLSRCFSFEGNVLIRNLRFDTNQSYNINNHELLFWFLAEHVIGSWPLDRMAYLHVHVHAAHKRSVCIFNACCSKWATQRICEQMYLYKMV